MKNKVTVTAPGKLMLLGEHAAVYGRPCLVTAINQRISITASRKKDKIFKITAQDINLSNYQKNIAEIGNGQIPKEAKFIEIAAKNFLNKYRVKNGISLESISDFYPKFGLGSSSAVIVCTIKSLSELFGINIKPKEIFDLSYKTILDIQRKGSGFDAAAAIYGGTLYFASNGKKIKPVAAGSLPLIVGYSGIKNDTVSLIDCVAQKAKKYPKIINGIYDQIEKIVRMGKTALQKNDWENLGNLMNFNQGYLESLGVSTKKLTNMVYAAVDSGAWGAKLSGAGGGDCIIALAPENKRQNVEKAIETAGGEIIKITANAPGIRVE
jgi:mevalonate kinase